MSYQHNHDDDLDGAVAPREMTAEKFIACSLAASKADRNDDFASMGERKLFLMDLHMDRNAQDMFAILAAGWTPVALVSILKKCIDRHTHDPHPRAIISCCNMIISAFRYQKTHRPEDQDMFSWEIRSFVSIEDYRGMVDRDLIGNLVRVFEISEFDAEPGPKYGMHLKALKAVDSFIDCKAPMDTEAAMDTEEGEASALAGRVVDRFIGADLHGHKKAGKLNAHFEAAIKHGELMKTICLAFPESAAGSASLAQHLATTSEQWGIIVFHFHGHKEAMDKVLNSAQGEATKAEVDRRYHQVDDPELQRDLMATKQRFEVGRVD